MNKSDKLIVFLLVALLGAWMYYSSKRQAEYNKALAEIKEAVELITDAQGANHFIEHINDYKNLGNSVILYARDLFSAKMKNLKVKYNKETKKYEDAA